MKCLLHLNKNNIRSLLILYIFLQLTTAQTQIRGVVKDATSGELLTGVTIIKSGTNIGTISDLNGEFTILAQIGESILVSYTGYESKTININSLSQKLEILLNEASKNLEEMVVIGYGSVGKKDLTGVVTRINEKDFNKGLNTAPEALLNGKVAGLQISRNGEPGGGSRIRLRGATSITANSSPLIVIDGIPLDDKGPGSGRNPLNFINTLDVESISVLKDASAAAIYGSRGANGVILITTKSGQSGKPKIAYSGNIHMSVFSGKHEFLSPQNFRNAINAKAPQEIEFLGPDNRDWVEEVVQNALGHDHNLSFSGGNKKTKYFLSGSFLQSNGVLKTSSHQRGSIGLNLNTSVFKDYLSIEYKNKTSFIKDGFAPNVMGSALAFDPTRPVKDGNPEFAGYYQWADPLATNNPVSTISLTDEVGNTMRTLNQLGLELKIPYVSGLSLRSNLSYDFTDGDKTTLRDSLLKDGENSVRGGYLQIEDKIRYTSSLIETYLNYKRTIFSNQLSLDATIGHSWQDFLRSHELEGGNKLYTTADGTLAYRDTIEFRQSIPDNRLISFFGRVNLGFREKYLLTASVRRDGSSRFGLSNRWGLFPAVAFGWRILEEDFAGGLKNSFSNLKLRASWGVTGNQEINDFLFKVLYLYSTDDARYQFGDEFVRTLRPSGVDPGIKWEQTTSSNIGLDFGILNDRLTGSLDFYRKYTNDLLFTVAAAAFTNTGDRILTNIGEMENKGVELALSGVLISNAKWDWRLGFNAAYNQNEITKLDNSNLKDFPGYEAGGISGDIGQNIQILRVGESIESFYTYQHKKGSNGKFIPDNVDANQDGNINLLDMYEDLNQDGLINEKDLSIQQKASPDWIFGLTSNTRFNKWDLSATLRANLGNYVYNNVASGSGYFERLTDRVTNNIHESAFDYGFNKRQLKSSVYIENASFLTIDNVSIGYTLGKQKLFQQLRIAATVQNLFVFSPYSGLDPELPQSMGGIDNNIYPVSRRYMLGLSVQF